MRCALYARVSTTDQNCEAQLRELREFAASKWWEAVEYVDLGQSGAKASRPQWDALMAAAKRREVDVVVVTKLDRAGRSVLHLHQCLVALKRYGVRLVVTSQGLDTDASSPTSGLLFTILAGVAEFERELIRERTVSGLKAAKARGASLGRPRRIFDRQAVVKLREEGLSWREIGRRLGVPTMTAKAAYDRLTAGVAAGQ